MKLIDICTVLSRGKTIGTQYNNTNGDVFNVRLIHIKHDGSVVLDNDYRYNIEDKNNYLYRYGVQNNDLIFSELTRNDFSVRLIKGIQPNIAIYSARVIFARINTELYNPVFLSKLLNNEKYNKTIIEQVYKGTIGYSAVKQIRMEELKNFEIPDIPLEEQERILKQDEKISRKIDKLKNELHTLYDV